MRWKAYHGGRSVSHRDTPHERPLHRAHRPPRLHHPRPARRRRRRRQLAAIDRSPCFRRVCLDPVRGIIALTAPSRSHEDLTWILDRIVDVAGGATAGASKGIGSTRLRGRGEPPGTGMEPDCAFYVGERAGGCFGARDAGDEALDACVERIAPDLVAEVEITHADEEQGRTLRPDGGAGAGAAAWPQGDEGAAGGLPRPACRERAAPARRLGGAGGTGAGGRPRHGLHTRIPGAGQGHGDGDRTRPSSTRSSARGGRCERERRPRSEDAPFPGRPRPGRAPFPGSPPLRFDRAGVPPREPIPQHGTILAAGSGPEAPPRGHDP